MADGNEENEIFQYSSSSLDDASKIQELLQELKSKNITIMELTNSKIQLHKALMEQTQIYQNKIRHLEHESSSYGMTPSSGTGNSTGEIRRLKEEIRTLTSQKESKYLLLDKLKNENDELTTKNRQLKEDLERYKKGIVEREVSCQQLTTRLKELQQKYESFVSQEREIESLTQQTVSLSQQLSDQHDMMEMMKSKCDEELQEAKRYQQQTEMQLMQMKEKYERPEYQDIFELSQSLIKLRDECPEIFRIFNILLMKGTMRSQKCLRIAELVTLLETGFLSLKPTCRLNFEDHESNSYEELHGKSLNEIPSPEYRMENLLGVPPPQSSKKIRRAPPPPPRPPSSFNNSLESNSRPHYDESDMTILRIFDFLTQAQILDIANYLCRTPILTTKTIELTKVDDADDGVGEDAFSSNHHITAAEQIVMNIGEVRADLWDSQSTARSNSSGKKVRILEDPDFRYESEDDYDHEAPVDDRERDDFDNPENMVEHEQEDQVDELYGDDAEPVQYYQDENRADHYYLGNWSNSFSTSSQYSRTSQVSQDVENEEIEGEYEIEDEEEFRGNDDSNIDDTGVLDEELVSEHLCFVIHRGSNSDEDPSTERWIEFRDPITDLPYYHNPDTG